MNIIVWRYTQNYKPVVWWYACDFSGYRFMAWKSIQNVSLSIKTLEIKWHGRLPFSIKKQGQQLKKKNSKGERFEFFVECKMLLSRQTMKKKDSDLIPEIEEFWKCAECCGCCSTSSFWYTSIYIINRTLHGRLGIRILPSRAESISHSFAALSRERYFQHSKIKFVSPRSHVISSMCTKYELAK